MLTNIRPPFHSEVSHHPHAHRLKPLTELEKENQRLRRAVSDLSLNKLILTEAARGAEGQRSATIEPFAPAGCIENVRQTLSASERRVFVEHYNHRRYHESLGNLTPADVYFGRGDDILSERRTIKEQTLKQRRLINQRQAA